MELKFQLFTLFVLFAAFGSTESASHSSGRRRYSDLGRFNSISANRPWATVPPPRHRDGNYTTNYPVVNATRYRPICADQWNSASPCGPFATVPPPINHGQTWNPNYPYPVYPRYPLPRHFTNRSQMDPDLLRRGYGVAGAPRSDSTAFNYGLYNGTEESLARPLSSHEGGEYNRNRSFPSGQTHPSQIYPQWSESPHRETATETYGTVPSATGTSFVAGNYVNSSYYSG